MLLKNYYQYLAMLFDRREETFKDVSGNNRSLDLGSYEKWCNGHSITLGSEIRVTSPEGEINYGIVVGTSDTPVSPYDYYINKISHGTSSGQLYYYATEVKDVVVSGDILELEVTRRLENKTSEDITVKEFGLIAKIKNYYFLIVREVSTVTVPAEGGILDISFKFKTTV